MYKPENGMKASISHEQRDHVHDEEYGSVRGRGRGEGKGNGPIFPVRSEPEPEPKGTNSK